MKPKTILAFVAIGAAAAILLNSKGGRKMTRSLLDCAEDMGGNLNKFTAKAGDQLTDLTDYVSREAMNFGDDARRRILNILGDAVDKVKSTKLS